MSDTIYLSPSRWGLCADAAGNIAVARAPYATAQEIACAIKLFAGELYFDTTQGQQWFEMVLGRNASLATIKAILVRAALTVNGVVSAIAVISSSKQRIIGGQVQATMGDGSVVTVDL